MKTHLKTLAPALLGFSLIAGAGWLNAQITDTIKAHVDHNFMIGDKSLPPGDYTFHMTDDPAKNTMIAENSKGDNVAQFTVRQSVNKRMPKHSQLTFRKYGDTEFLVRMYEGGRTNGLAVTQESKEEKRLIHDGKHGVEMDEDLP